MNLKLISILFSCFLFWITTDCQDLKCSESYVPCLDQTYCIPINATCDGIFDCADKSDEIESICQSQTCPPDKFTCNYGGCIAFTAVCDTIINCPDLSDERNCDLTVTGKKCGLGMVGCRSGDECIRLDQKCDGKRDCRDNSDEAYQTCIGIQCPSGEFQCKYGACIENNLVCDGKPDCADGSDENLTRCPSSFPIDTLQKCVSDDFQCNSGICINKAEVCDGIRNCDDGSDETIKLCKDIACDTSSNFQCKYGACVPLQKLTCEHCVDRSYNDTKCGTQGRDELSELSTGGVSFGIQSVGMGYPTPSLEGHTSTSRPRPSYPSHHHHHHFRPTTTMKPTTDDRIHFLQKCEYPTRPANGRYTSSVGFIQAGTDAKEWTVLKFSCNTGYGLTDYPVIVCIDGRWNNEFPECAAKCQPLESDSHEITCTYKNREIPCNEAIDGSVANIKCKDAYEVENTILQPYNVIRCKGGEWNKVLFECKPECGILVPKGQALVIKGYTAVKGDFPWHAGLYKWKGDDYEQICGGSLISERVVISAAHCFWDWTNNEPKTDPAKYAVAVGKFYRSWDNTKDIYSQKFSVDQIYIPKKFRADESSFANDIALIMLNDTVKFTSLVRPVCTDWSNTLHKFFFKQGIEGSVAGWGLTEEYGVAAEELQAVRMPYIDFDNCINEVPATFRPFLTYDKICGGFRNGTSLCTGDSGGGYAFRKNNRFFIEGIVSVAPAKGPSCDSYKYAAFTKIGEHLNWLIDLQKNSDKK